MIGGELAKYTHHYLGNREIGGVSCHLVENRLKPEFTGKSDFPRSILALSADRMTMVQWELFDRSNRLARKMVATETKVVDGTPTVTRAWINSPQRDSQLQFNVQSIEFDPPFKPDLFRKEFLKRPLPPAPIPEIDYPREPAQCSKKPRRRRSQVSRAPALPCGSFEEKQPIVTEDEPPMDTNKHK